jgi:hypothetical protein
MSDLGNMMNGILDNAPDAVLVLRGEPVAWSYELAAARREGGTREYIDWRPCLTTYKPNVPPGSIRKLRPLYAGAVEQI